MDSKDELVYIKDDFYIPDDEEKTAEASVSPVSAGVARFPSLLNTPQQLKAALLSDDFSLFTESEILYGVFLFATDSDRGLD